MENINPGKHGRQITIDEHWSFRLSLLVNAGAMVAGKISKTKVCYQSGGVHRAFFAEVNLSQPDDAWLFIKFDDEHYPHEIALESTPQPFGGVRWWMRCPSTGIRCHRIYYKDGYFMSGRYMQLPYRSQQLSSFDRKITRMHSILQKHDIKADGIYHVKPNGMHDKTYYRIINQVEDLREQAWQVRAS